MKKGQLIERYKKVVTPTLGHYNDLEIAGGKGAYLFGVDGRKYLDFSCGIAVTSLGHCHPSVAKAAKKQLDNLEHICIGVAYYEKYIQLAEKLSSVTLPGLEMCFFCQDGSGAIEAAVKLAKYTTKRTGMVCFNGSFHGRTYAAMSLTNSKQKYKQGYAPLMGDVYTAPYPYCYRCEFNGNKPNDCTKCGFECLKKVEEIVQNAGKDKIAGMVIEPVLGEGGYAPPPADYLKKLKAVCEKNGILLIFDEVQTGFGRTGKLFAHEHFGVIPDIMVMAKAIANGLPLGGIIASRALMEQWSPGAHGGTYGGNPVSCAAALAVMDTIEKERLVDNSAKMGAYLKEKLALLKSKSVRMGDVRGLGLMVGVEFIKENEEPDPEVTKAVMKGCLDNGLLLISCGLYDNVIRFIPPLNVTKKQIDEALKVFEGVICKM